MENKLIKSLKETIKSKPAMELIKEYAELSLDLILDDETIKNIPVFNTIVGVYKLGKSLKDRQNIKKISVFLNNLKDVPETSRNSFIQKLEESDKFRETMFEKILIMIERLDETVKAEIVGNLFKLYVMEAIDREKFLRFSGIVERALLYDLLALHYRESTFYRDWEGKQDYYLSKENLMALSAFGLAEQVLEDKPSERLRGAGYDGTEPTIVMNVSDLGRELANYIFYNLNDQDYYSFICEKVKDRKEYNRYIQSTFKSS
ncbi:hypothetical protein [Pedobacter panaciterrae]